MIFVTVGMQLGFDRLIRAMDGLAAGLDIPVIAQTGRGSYQPQHMEARTQIAPAEFERLVADAQLIVSHAGIGTVLTAARFGRPIVLVPRRADLHEHRNDHQRGTVKQLAGRAGILIAHDETELAACITEGLTTQTGPERRSPSERQLHGALAAFIENRQA